MNMDQETNKLLVVLAVNTAGFILGMFIVWLTGGFNGKPIF